MNVTDGGRRPSAIMGRTTHLRDTFREQQKLIHASHFTAALVGSEWQSEFNNYHTFGALALQHYTQITATVKYVIVSAAFLLRRLLGINDPTAFGAALSAARRPAAFCLLGAQCLLAPSSTRLARISLATADSYHLA